mmetsp:Transcript_6729/g.12023  ORF Transcript_6729/g.12023 Transcript_6729/m.12023 type:complete len:319 (+) Transcript_6729:496-1452(+)
MFGFCGNWIGFGDVAVGNGGSKRVCELYGNGVRSNRIGLVIGMCTENGNNERGSDFIPSRDDILSALTEEQKEQLKKSKGKKYSQFEMLDFVDENDETPDEFDPKTIKSVQRHYTLALINNDMDLSELEVKVKKIVIDAQCSMDFVLLTRIKDPFWGENRNFPVPGRLLLICTSDELDKLTTHGHQLSKSLEELSEVKVVPADYYVLDDLGSFGKSSEVKVGVQMVNADWTKKDNVHKMRSTMIDFAEACVESKKMSRCVVLQSVKERSFFKMMEFFESTEAVESYIQKDDKEFDETIKPFRAAVNRVRQLYLLSRHL